jgi:hypothetical protein
MYEYGCQFLWINESLVSLNNMLNSGCHFEWLVWYMYVENVREHITINILQWQLEARQVFQNLVRKLGLLGPFLAINSLHMFCASWREFFRNVYLMLNMCVCTCGCMRGREKKVDNSVLEKQNGCYHWMLWCLGREINEWIIWIMRSFDSALNYVIGR